MRKIIYNITARKSSVGFRAAVVADLHAKDPAPVIDILLKEKPDYIFVPGDLFEPLCPENSELNKNGFDFLEKAVKIAPVFFSPGNHELGGSFKYRNRDVSFSDNGRSVPYHVKMKLSEMGVRLLDNGFVDIGDIRIGGLTSGLLLDGARPLTEWLDGEFSMGDKYRILLCHHPEYYEKYLKDRNIDLIISGHAHGGQARLFGMGMYAPGQGFFPKYDGGVFDGRLVVSRGCANTAPVPRAFNPREVVIISVK